MNIIVDNMIEVLLESSDDFLKIRETLTRIGVASKKDKKIFQSCHILHKQNRYFIVHFKELFAKTMLHVEIRSAIFLQSGICINLSIQKKQKAQSLRYHR